MTRQELREAQRRGSRRRRDAAKRSKKIALEEAKISRLAPEAAKALSDDYAEISYKEYEKEWKQNNLKESMASEYEKMQKAFRREAINSIFNRAVRMSYSSYDVQDILNQSRALGYDTEEAIVELYGRISEWGIDLESEIDSLLEKYPEFENEILQAKYAYDNKIHSTESSFKEIDREEEEEDEEGDGGIELQF